MENGRDNEAELAEIQVSGIHMKWNPRRGTCTFEKMPVAMMWVDTTLAGLMSGVQAMVGTERFLLALQSEGRKSVETDWEVISQFPDFREGFKAIANIAAVAGWGEWLLTSIDEMKKECRFRVTDSWEGRYQKALGVCWGSGMIAGKMAGYCSKLFGTNCWADQTAFIARGDAFDEFVVSPSSRIIETEIDNLLASDKATRADMAVAILRLKKEITDRQRAEQALRKSEEKFRGIFNNARDGILVADIETKKFILGNAKICKMLGCSMDELVSMGVEDIHPAENLTEVIDRFNKLVRQETILAVDIPVKRKDGSLFFADINSFLIEFNGNPCLVGFFRDITERKRTEEKLKQNLREITLLNNISHLVSSNIPLKHMVHATVNGIAEYLGADLVILFLKEDRNLPLLSVGPQDSRYKLDSVPAHCLGECLCGLAALDGHPKYSYDISTDARCTMLECKGAGLRSFAALPLKSGGRVIGVLGLASALPRDFEKQSQLLETLAAEISLGFKNSLLLEEAMKRNDELLQQINARKKAEVELRHAHDALEFRVEERTVELGRANMEIKKSEERMRFLTSKILSAQEQERKRISYELHDNLGQSLVALKLELRTIQRMMPPSGPEKEAFESTLNELNNIVENVRRISMGLSPLMLEDLGLVRGLKTLFEEICNLEDIDCSFALEEISSLLSSDRQIIIYRICQEIFGNAIKHAKASRIKLSIQNYDGGVQFSIMDNGIGFDVDQTMSSHLEGHGMGLVYMEEQVRMLGGTINIKSKKGKGTKTIINVPFNGGSNLNI
jgi:PAS domain S-box-containing protein